MYKTIKENTTTWHDVNPVWYELEWKRFSYRVLFNYKNIINNKSGSFLKTVRKKLNINKQDYLGKPLPFEINILFGQYKMFELNGAMESVMKHWFAFFIYRLFQKSKTFDEASMLFIIRIHEN